MQGILYDKLNCNMSGYCYDEKCTKCRSSEIGMCDRCELGYRVSGNGIVCESRIENCENFDSSSFTCNGCETNYILYDNLCY